MKTYNPYLCCCFVLIESILSAFGVTTEFASEVNPKWTMPMWMESVPLIWRGEVYTHKSLYVGEVYVGMPSKKYKLVFDTGSGNTVLPQVGCPSLGCANKQLYNASASSTSQRIVDTLGDASSSEGKVYIRYGDGDLSGSCVRDRICLAEDALCVMLGVVQSHRMATNPFALFPVDGVLGLGLHTLALNPSFSFINKVMEQYPNMLGQLSIFLTNGCGSRITLGGYDEMNALGEPKWVNVAEPDKGYWQATAQSLILAGIPTDYCEDGECRVITDLGATLIVVPDEIYKMLHETMLTLIPEELYDANFKCTDHVNKSKDISLKLNDFFITIPPIEFMNPKPLKRTYRNGTIRHICTTTIHHISIPAPLKPKTFILGHPLLRTYYSLYDWEKLRIGFVLANKTGINTSCGERPKPHPVYVRSLDSGDYYLPHLTGQDPRMDQMLQTFKYKSDATQDVSV